MRHGLMMAALLLATGAAAGEVVPPTLMSMTTGTCTAMVNGVDVGCNGKAVHSVLQNGRHLFDFTTDDVTVIGFAGPKLLLVDPDLPSLNVDHVFLDQNRYDADGACAFRTTMGGKGFSHVECKALLRDGRKVSATLDGIAGAPFKIGGTGQPAAGAQASAELPKRDGERCGRLMQMHGFLSRAQFQCRFNGYNQKLIDEAAVCGAKAGEATFKDDVASGMKTFDRDEKERGRGALCAEILKEFPSYVRR